METKGVIYILTNPSFKDYVKIGYADDINKRLKQLNRSECVPFAFHVYATYEVSDRLSDIQIHNIIDSLNPNLRAIETFEGKKRVREFYAMSAEDAYKLLEGIAKINGLTKNLKRHTPSLSEKQDEETANEIKSLVLSVIPAEYQDKPSFSVDVLSQSDGGYSVTVQIDVDSSEYRSIASDIYSDFVALPNSDLSVQSFDFLIVSDGALIDNFSLPE